jgi:acyl-[acyl-carrier-protein]-phospholipid O-acyltransferase/long-chain-fatty-acid--[acyl-carrier-protein] ligase
MQTVGMFTDTLLKMVVVLMLVGPQKTEGAQQAASFRGFLAFTLPFVALSLWGGVLSERWGKRRTLIVLKSAEVGVMVLAGFALWLAREWAVLGVLSLLGTLTALASPSKYGLIPELLPEQRLARGNGLFILMTWVATIVGQGLAGWLLDTLGPDRRWHLGIATGALAVLGLLFTLRIPHVPVHGHEAGVLATARAGWHEIKNSRSLRLAVGGSLFFWTLGALLQQDVIVYAKAELVLSDTDTGFLNAALAMGIGAGGLLCGYLTRGSLGTRWIHRGAAAMGITLVALGLLPRVFDTPSEPARFASLGLVFLLGVSAGLMIVPLNSLMQGRAPPARRGTVIAVLNVFVFTGILVGSLAGAGLGQTGFRSTTIFLVGAALAFVASAAARVARSHLDEPLPGKG